MANKKAGHKGSKHTAAKNKGDSSKDSFTQTKATGKRVYTRYMQDPIFFFMGVLIILLAMAALFFALGSQGPAGGSSATANTTETSGDNSTQLPQNDSRVVVYEFSDFACPYCGAASGFNTALIDRFKKQNPSWRAIVPALRGDYSDRVRLVFKHYIVHESARKASEAAECARDQGQFWPYHDILFQNQGSLSESDLKGYAKDLGLNMSRFNSCLDSGEKAGVVSKDTELGKSLSVKGTPTFLIGANTDNPADLGNLLFSEMKGYIKVYEHGTIFVGAQSFSDMEKYIKMELDPSKKQAAAEAKGVEEKQKKAAIADALAINSGDNKPQIDFFVMSYCPYGNIAEEAIEPVYRELGDAAIFNPHYIISESNGNYRSLHGDQELHEDIRELCVNKYMGIGKYFDFVLAMNKNCSASNADSCWQSVAEGLGLDSSVISHCEENEFSELADAEIALTNTVGVTGSPTVFIDGSKFSGQRTAQGYLDALCAAFDSPPEACGSKLSDRQAAPSGSC